MMKAIKNFMNKPITWGDSFKWSGTFLGLYAAVIGACVAYEKWTNYKAEKDISRIQWRRQSGGQEARRLIFLSRYGRTMH